MPVGGKRGAKAIFPRLADWRRPKSAFPGKRTVSEFE